MIRNFSSVADFVKESDRIGYGGYFPYGQDYSTTKRKALKGDESLVPRAEKLLETLETAVPETLQPQWHSDVYGPVISVPDHLTGLPTSFRRMSEAASESAPIKVYVGIMSSAGISFEDLEKRGVAITALVMKLQAIRPVDIVLYTEWGFGNNDREIYSIVIPLESRPLSLAHVIDVLADGYFFRQLGHTVAYHDGVRSGGPWPVDYRTASYPQRRNAHLGATANDLVIPSVCYGDPILANPVKWINDNLQKLVVLETEPA